MTPCFVLILGLVLVTSQYSTPKLGNARDIPVGPLSAVYTTQCGTYSHYAVNFVDPCQDLLLELTVQIGMPDIYVSRTNPYPTKYDLTWSAFPADRYNLKIFRNDSMASPGYYYISIYGDCSSDDEPSIYQMRVTPSITPSVSEYNIDILGFPEISTNQNMNAKAFSFFEFCLPYCADVNIKIQSCRDKARCPTSYFFPELFVSRNPSTSSLEDFSYKLASKTRNSIWINHTDPSGRGLNGFMQGKYYVAVYGACDETDGSCSFVRNSKYTVTVTTYKNPKNNDIGQCAEESSAVMKPSLPQYTPLVSGVSASGTVQCSTLGPLSYTYYSIAVPSPCNDLRFLLFTSGTSKLNFAQLMVGKYPNVRPTFETIGWSSYEKKGTQILTISGLDASFTGGSVCGPSGTSVCQYYIAVAGYCAAPNSSQVDFTLTANLIPLGKGIFQAPLVNQKVLANQRNLYTFCVDSVVDVTAQLKSFTNACQCPTSYANLGVLISRYRANAGHKDLTWKLLGSNNTGSLSLSKALIIPGTYYLNVLGNCESECSEQRCTCAPCTNLPVSPYALYVGGVAEAVTWSSSYNTGSCAVPGITGGLYGQCGYLCPYTVSMKKNFFDEIPSLGAQFGIAGAVLSAFICIFGCCFFCNYQTYVRGSYSKMQFLVLSRGAKELIYEMPVSSAIRIAPQRPETQQ